MRNPRIFQPQTLSNNTIITLDENGSRHIGKALRMQPGDSVRVFNGEGGEYQAVVVETTKKSVKVELQEYSDENKCSPLRIHLAQVMSRGDRMDYAIQKAVELGVSEITPLTSSRCEVKLNPQRSEKRLYQWQQQVVSACEQCGLNTIPTVNPCVSLQDFCIQANEERKVLLHPKGVQAKNFFSTEPPSSTCIIIGPEGGLDDAEITFAEDHDFDCLALGPRVFRTETAPIAMLTLLQHYWGDL